MKEYNTFDDFHSTLSEDERNELKRLLWERHWVTVEQQTKTLKEELVYLFKSLFIKNKNEQATSSREWEDKRA